MPDPKKPWEKNYSVENTESQELKPWEKNYVSDTEKKNPIGISSSPGKNSELAPTTGSSAGKNANGFPKIDSNSVAPNFEEMKPAVENSAGKEKRLREKLANVKVTPENMDAVMAETDSLSATIKSNQQAKEQARSKRVKELETSFYDATRNNDDDAVAEQRLQDAVQVNGVWNNVKSIAKKSYNTAIDALSSTSPTLIGLQSAKVNTDPLGEEKLQVKQQAIKNKETLSDSEITQRAHEIFKEKEKDNLFLDRANSFLDDLDSKDKEILRQDRALKADHLQEENLKRLKVVSAMRSVADEKISEYKNIENQLSKLKESGQPFPEDLYDQYTSLGSEIKNIGAELQKNENYILNNKKDLGTAQQELDLFNREYGDFKNFIGNIGASTAELGTGLLGAGNYIASFSPNIVDQVRAMKGQEVVSGLNKDIEENRKNLRTPVGSVESPEGFLNYASDLVANQLPILATTATGAGGLSVIGASSAGKKYTDMNNEVRDGKASYSPFKMATAPLLYGGAEMAGEYATMGILRKGGRVIESIVRGEADLIKKTALQKAKEWSKDFGIDTSKEMAGEQFTNFAQNFNEKYVLGKKDVGLLDNTGQVFKDTFTLTSILKAAPHMFGAVVKPFQSKTDLGTLDENSRKIIEFSKQLNSEDLTETERSVIQKQIEKATAESSKIVSNTIGKIDDMPSELYDEVVNLNTKAGEIKSQAREINDGSLPNKNQLLEGLQEDYKALQEKRNGIIEGNTTVVDVLPLKEQEKLKKQAMEDLVTELNPDGKKNIKITNEQVVERANEIYNDSKKNEEVKPTEDAATEPAPFVSEVVIPPVPEDYNIVDEKPKTEGNSPLLPSETQQNGSEAAVNLPQKMNFTEEEKSKVQKKVVNKPRVILRSGKVGTDAFFALPNEGVFGEVVDKIGNDENVTAYRYPKDFKIKDLSNDVVFDEYMSKKMFEETRKEGYDAAYVMEIDGSKVLHVINPQKLTLLDEKLPELRNNETISTTNTPTDGNVRSRTAVVEQNGTTEPKNTTTESISKTADSRKSEGNIDEQVESSTVNYRGSNFAIEKGANGEVKIFKKDGTEISQYSWRKTKDSTKGKKRVKNVNYYKILAVSEGKLTDNEINVANKKQIQESIDNFIPTTEHEFALLEVAKGTKFSKESLERELGSKDSNWASDQFSKKKKPSIENVAEGIVSENQDSNLDEKEVRDALIDVLGSFSGLDAVRKEINDIHQKSIDPYHGLSEEESIAAYEEYMTDSEKSLFDSVQAESNLNELEKLKYYQEQYEKSIESLSEEDRAGIYEQYESERLSDPSESNETGNSEESSRKQEEKSDSEGIEHASEHNRNSSLVSERVPFAKITPKNAPKKLVNIIKNVSKGLKATLIYGRSKRRNSAGTYNPRNTLVRISKAGDIDTVAHELGHFLDDRHDILGTIPETVELATVRQLKWYAERGGSNPPSGLSKEQKAEYLQREGLAEFIRSYVANPEQTKILAPELFSHFESAIDENTKKVLKQFSEDFLDYANASGIEKTLSNVEDIDLPNKNKFIDWVKSFRNNEDKLGFSKMDKFYAEMANSNHFGIKAFKTLVDMQGKAELKSHENFEIMSRIFLGINGKLENIFSTGLINAKNEKLKAEGGVFAKNDKGRTVYEDGTPMTTQWLIEGLDTTSEESLSKEMNEVVAMAIAERTIEYSKKLERTHNLTGIGGSLESDLSTAVNVMNEFSEMEKSDKEKYNRIKNGVKRYRQMADSTLRYAVEKGRISEEQYKKIKEGNEYYVALNRNIELEPGEDMFDSFNTGTNGIGASKEIIHKIKGGNATIENPYLSLLKNMNNIIKEADRNEVMSSFVEPLISTRQMGEGEAVNLAKIGRIANEGDKNTISVFRNGKQEKWQFQEDIYKSLKNIESISSNPIMELLSKPSQLIRWTVTNNPVFYARNIVKDTQGRMIVSKNNSTIKDMFHNAGDKEMFELFGGSQAGHLHTSKESYAKSMTNAAKEITKKGGIVLNFGQLGQKYSKFLQTGENLNRIAEFNRSYKVAKEKGMSDYDAGLYAAFEARDLMDFAVAGHTMREINKIIVFSNAGVQSLRKAKKSVLNDPAGFAFRTLLYSVIPSLFFAGLRSVMGDDDEYEELPDNQRDMFYNFKTKTTGDAWISIPKPYELGLASAFIDRGISKIRGHKEAFDGITGTAMKTLMPFDESSFLGGLKPIIETKMNRDTFTGRSIIPEHEQGKLLELRKGINKASYVGQKMSKYFKQAGMSIDPRNIDHIMKGYGTYFANQGIAVTDLMKKERSDVNYWISKSGFAKDVPTYNAKSFKKTSDLAVELGKTNSKTMKLLRAKIEEFQTEENLSKRKKLLKEIFIESEKTYKTLTEIKTELSKQKTPN